MSNLGDHSSSRYGRMFGAYREAPLSMVLVRAVGASVKVLAFDVEGSSWKSIGRRW